MSLYGDIWAQSCQKSTKIDQNFTDDPKNFRKIFFCIFGVSILQFAEKSNKIFFGQFSPLWWSETKKFFDYVGFYQMIAGPFSGSTLSQNWEELALLAIVSNHIRQRFHNSIFFSSMLEQGMEVVQNNTFFACLTSAL